MHTGELVPIKCKNHYFQKKPSELISAAELSLDKLT